MKDTGRVDFWAGIGLIASSLAVWAMTANLMKVERGIGPGDYPRVIAVMLFILGVCMTVTNCIHGYSRSNVEKIEWKGLLRTAILAVGAFVYVWLLPWVGFPLLTPFFLFGTIKLFGYKKNLTAALVSIETTAVLFLLFNIVFMIFLPLGILG